MSGMRHSWQRNVLLVLQFIPEYTICTCCVCQRDFTKYNIIRFDSFPPKNAKNSLQRHRTDSGEYGRRLDPKVVILRFVSRVRIYAPKICLADIAFSKPKNCGLKICLDTQRIQVSKYYRHAASACSPERRVLHLALP
jgi:hypothetical protein